ncbi:energy-coupling factor ABC transporter ATP-binding protein [Sporosarcina sp. P12(2017)]|uniref:energy-coupling factor ABC transporter ATP-binding protein n=1 Tax=unclassified Sporosarcina TaxID=2647733 RepID=UPI000C16980C|nr:MULTISPECIES: energy-coupling factor ABC transporter ATP-binding protein [unclassified Sporosarcina]PIC58160.1 energy-coupling factor ABC transporter ATP-binding protein [Sporosarcina sp. P10]PIC61662.1 energy-coupling factor ABC transporter ATP-binding protein [Sporosarcina sp. P12(2017)]
MDISLQQVGYLYAKDSPFEKRALQDVTATIPSGSYTSIIGHTGSGKSTLLLHLNGLLKPSEGIVQIGDTMITAQTKGKKMKEVRNQVGIVFQFPEHQLFEETVEKDIMFGPINFGVPKEEARARAHELVKLLGLPEDVLQKSPFELSGGQMRRVAIAGVLAFKPSVLVLDEPTAGLDPKGRKEIMELFHHLHKTESLTTILVTHSMEDAARYSDRILVMHEGTAVMEGTPEEIYSLEDQLHSFRLSVPRSVRFQREIEKMSGQRFDRIALTEDTLAQELAKAIARKGERPC